MSRTVIDGLPGFITLYSDGSYERLKAASVPCSSRDGAVATADVRIDALNGVWARIFMPPLPTTSTFTEKEKQQQQQELVPVVLHLHGGGFCIGSPSAPLFHDFCEKMTARSGCIWISLHFRLAPEHPLPAAYDDAFAAVRWLHSRARQQRQGELRRPAHVCIGTEISDDGRQADDHHHQNGKGYLQLQGEMNGTRAAAQTPGFQVEAAAEDGSYSPHVETLIMATETEYSGYSESGQFNAAGEALGLRWLARHADFSRCFLAGESSGGTMVHFTAARASAWDVRPLRIRGLVFIHPSFLQGDPRPDEDTCTSSPCLQSLSRMVFYHKACMPPGAPWSHPWKNPLHADATPKLSDIDLPPALVMVAGIDMLRPGALDYYQALKQDGKDAQLFVSQEVGHCFHLCTPGPSPKVQEFETRLIEFLHSF